MRRRTRLVLSAACGTLAMLLASSYAEAAQREAESARAEALERYGGEVTNLVVAREGLAAGDVVGESDVEVREWLADLAPEGSLSTVDDVVGQRLTSAVAAGSPLSEVAFAGGEGTVEVPDGRVAVTVRITDKTGVTGSLANGARLLVYEVGKDGTSLVSGDATVVGASERAGSAAASTGSSVTLAVAPECVTRVLRSGADGSLRLALPAEGVEGVTGQTDPADPVTAEPATVDAETPAGGEGDQGGEGAPAVEGGGAATRDADGGDAATAPAEGGEA